MWIYEQRTGNLTYDGKVIGVGYSGHAEGKNNPELQMEHEIGPIPQGVYAIGPPCETLHHGPYVMALTPAPDNQMFGRSMFLIHGDSKVAPGTASLGCIILSRMTREAIWNSGDRNLKVVAG